MQHARLLRDVSVAFMSGGVADVACQSLEGGLGKKDALRWDVRRSFAFAAFTGVYIGGVCNGIYSLYPRLARRLLNRAPSPREEGVVATMADNFIHVPALYIPVFYVSTSLIRGESGEAAVGSLRSNWTESVTACIVFWLPAQYVIFSMIPAAARVRCVAAGDFVWNIALSYMANRSKAAAGPPPPPGVPPEAKLRTARTGTGPVRIS